MPGIIRFSNYFFMINAGTGKMQEKKTEWLKKITDQNESLACLIIGMKGIYNKPI